MFKKLLFILISLHQSLSDEDTTKTDFYTAAILDYAPEIGEENDLNLTVTKCISFITQAAMGEADIIVFPAFGITGLPKRKADEERFSVQIPDPKEELIPCLDDKFKSSKILYSISCAAKDYKIYVVININEEHTPEEGSKICINNKCYYNTNVVFDRKGAVIARYRSLLSQKSAFTKIKITDIELSIFETDFGVTFGTFTTFDILYPKPALELALIKKIDSFVYTSAWFSFDPYLIATAIQAGWSYTNNVTLLASGYNDPIAGIGGSGIYLGRNGPLIEYTPKKREDRMFIKKVPKPKTSYELPLETEKIRSDGFDVNFLDEGPSMCASIVLNFETQSKISEELCVKELCCSFDVEIDLNTSKSDRIFRIYAFNGYRKYEKFKIFDSWTYVCVILSCLDYRLRSCKSERSSPGMNFTEISINGNFTYKYSFYIPLTLDIDTLPMTASEFNFYDSIKDIKMNLTKPTNNVSVFGIYGRNFMRRPPYLMTQPFSQEKGSGQRLLYNQSFLSVTAIVVFSVRTKYIFF